MRRALRAFSRLRRAASHAPPRSRKGKVGSGDAPIPNVPPRRASSLSSESEEDDDVCDDLPQLKDPKMVAKMSQARHSVSAEVYGQWNKKKPFDPPNYPKSAEQMDRIRKTIMNSFMFNRLPEDDLNTVIAAFKEMKVDPGSEFIRQGDDGDCLYLIEKGDVIVTKKVNGERKYLCTMKPGDAVGELALLYNTPRAACCAAPPEEEIMLWRLDRESFNHIVKDAARRRRETYESFLQEVPILETMDPYERCKLCDGLQSDEWPAGSSIITQGQMGDTFFMIEDGEAEAIKDDVVVMKYGRGDYFGELALIRNQPRAATVRAITNVKTISLDRHSFDRLMGPIEDLLKRKAGRYEEIEARLRDTNKEDTDNSTEQQVEYKSKGK